MPCHPEALHAAGRRGIRRSRGIPPVLVIAALLPACRGRGAVEVEIARVKPRAVFRSTVVASGEIVAERYADVGSSGGFAEALPDRVTILAESAERRRDIDVERARAALERAQKRLAEQRSKEKIDFARAQAALQRALMRLKV